MNYYLWFGCAIFNIFIYLFFYGHPINYLVGMLKDAYISYTRMSFRMPKNNWHHPPMNRGNDSPKKSRQPLVVYIHGLYGTPLVWNRYCTEHYKTGAIIYTPWVLWHRDESKCLIEWSTPIQSSIQAFIANNPDVPVVIYSTSYGSIFTNDMLMELIEKNISTQFYWYSIVGANLYGSWWCRFWLSKLILKYLFKLPSVVIERLAREKWSYGDYVNSRMLKEDTTEMGRFSQYNGNTFKNNFKHVSWVEKYDWQLLMDPKKTSETDTIIHCVSGFGHSYILDKGFGMHFDPFNKKK